MATKTTKDFIIQLTEIWAKSRSGSPDVSPPSTSKISHGFDYGEKPSHATFNWIMYKVMLSAVAFQQYGILTWDPTIKYEKGAIVQDQNTNLVHQAIVKNDNIPLTDRNTWKAGIEDSGEYVKKDGNNPANDPTGGTITGDIVIKSGARLIIEA